jgi:hypothetical protein
MKKSSDNHRQCGEESCADGEIEELERHSARSHLNVDDLADDDQPSNNDEGCACVEQLLPRTGS